MNAEIIKEFAYKMADDLLIMGHRNSEWTGLGPMLEEDIAFSSMAQDKVGQSHEFYKILQALGESDPDTVAFMRNADQFHNCQFAELPIGDYDFSLMRHFLFDNAYYLKYQMLRKSTVEDFANLASKFASETKYHIMHANTMILQLATSNETAVRRMQEALDYSFPYALGIFEPSPFEDELMAQQIFEGELRLQEQWLQEINSTIDATELALPGISNLEAKNGGRLGQHSEHLQPLLDEMSEVFKTDPAAEW